MSKYRKFNKYEKREIKSQIVKEALAGSGLYLYQNSNANAELTLPRPTKSGVRIIAAGGQFQGDDYYMQLVRTGMLRLVEVLQTPEQESQGDEETMNESTDRLILDQPETVTQSGPVEHVVQDDQTKQRPLNESQPEAEKQPVLLNEAPVADDGFVIVEEN